MDETTYPLVEAPSEQQTLLVLPPLEPDLSIYYRSRVFNAKTGINTLISHAQPLLALLSYLSRLENLPTKQHCEENIAHELKTFESKAVTANIDNEFISLARCLLKIHLNKFLKPAEENDAQEELPSLELIYQHILQKPAHYIEIIELAYLCLSMKNSLQQSADPQQDYLYHYIRSHRGDVVPPLMLTQKQNTLAPRRNLSLKFVMILASISVVISYIGYSFLLRLNTAMIPLPTTTIMQERE